MNKITEQEKLTKSHQNMAFEKPESLSSSLSSSSSSPLYGTPNGSSGTHICGDGNDDVDDGLDKESDIEEVLRWKPYPDIVQSTNIHIVPFGGESSMPLTLKEASVFKGRSIIIEGGVGQGKSELGGALLKQLECFGIKCVMEKEPVDTHALRLFIKFQKLPSDNASIDALEFDRLREAKIKASEMMQFSMMRKRSEAAARISNATKNGGVGIMDRGPFGDAAFMNTTFSQAGVPNDLAMQYVIEFMQRYINIGFDGKNVVILRLRAPPEIALSRWLSRESSTSGNKYTIEYVRSLEEAHDKCGHAWGRHFVYDNSLATKPGTPGYTASVCGLMRFMSEKLREWDLS